MSDASMRVLVTGANGFVGRHLCAELLHRGQSVRATVRATGVPQGNLEQVIIQSIDGRTDWSGCLHGVDVVIHLAARAHILKEKAEDPLAVFMEVNFHGTKNLAFQAAQADVKRFVYVSTVGVNGNNTNGRHPFSEQDEPNPQSPYATSKFQAELALRKVTAETKLEVTVVRPPLVYGASAPGNVAEMLRVLAKRIPLPLASVHNQRSLIYIDNLVDALILCATHSAAAGKTYLVSDGEDISTPELLRRLGGEMHQPATLLPCPSWFLAMGAKILGQSYKAQSLLGSLRIDSGKIRRELNWTPPCSLQQGLQLTAEWYRNTHL